MCVVSTLVCVCVVCVARCALSDVCCALCAFRFVVCAVYCVLCVVLRSSRLAGTRMVFLLPNHSRVVYLAHALGDESPPPLPRVMYTPNKRLVFVSVEK